MPENTGPKIISSLGLNYESAIKSTQEFAKSLETLDQQLEKTKKTAVITANEINQAFGKTGKQFIADGEKLFQIIPQQAQKMAQVTQQQLAKLESSLVSTAEKMQRLGVTVPGLNTKIGEIRGYQDQLIVGRQLTEEQTKAVAMASEYAVIQARNAQTLEREVKILTDGVKAEEMRTDAASRRQMAEVRAQEAINKQWDAEIAKQRTLNEQLKTRQESDIWTAHEKQNTVVARQAEERAQQEIKQYNTMLATEALREKEAALAAKAQEKAMQSAIKTLPAMEAQVAAVQSKLRVEELGSTQLANQANIIRSQIVALQERLAIEGKLTQAETAQVGVLKQQLATLQANTRTAIADLEKKSLGQSGQTDFMARTLSPLSFAHHLNFWIASGVLFGIYDTLGSGIVKYEQGLKNLSTVLPQINKEQTEFKATSESMLRTMERYGTSLDETMQIGRSVGRMYKETATVLGLVDQITLLNVIDQVELEAATKGVEAGMATYGKTLKSTNEVLAFSGSLIDKITALSHNAFASGTDLVEIIQRSASAAINAKTTLDQLLGIGAASTRATGMGGAQIGNMLKSVLAQLSAPTKEVIEQIEGIGVKIHDANGQLRNAYDIIIDLSMATKDATLSQDDLNEALLKASRGVFQYSKFAALVGSFEQIVKNTSIALESQGITLKMAAQQLDTIARKAATTRNILIDMFAGAGDSGLRSSLKSAIDTLNQFLLGLKNASTGIIRFGSVIGLAGIGLRIIRGLYAAVNKEVLALIPATQGATIAQTWATIAKTLHIKATQADTAAIVGNTAATGALTGAKGTEAGAATGAAGAMTELAIAEGAEATAATGAAAATGALNTALNLNPVVLAVTLALAGLAAGLGYYTFKTGEAEKKTLDLRQAMVDEHQQALQEIQYNQSRAEFIRSMGDAREKLNQRIKSGKLSSAELKATESDLKAVEEALNSTLDDKEKQILKQFGLTDLGIQKIQEHIKEINKEKIAAINAEIENTNQKKQQTKERIDAITKEIQAEKNLLKAKNAKFSAEVSLRFGANYAIKTLADQLGLGSLIKKPLFSGEPSEVTAKRRELESEKAQYKEYEKDIAALIEENQALANSLGGDIVHAPYGGSESDKSSKTKTYLDKFKELLENIIPPDVLRQFQQWSNALDQTERNIGNLAAEEELLKSKIDAGNATEAERIRLQEVIATRTAYLNNQTNTYSLANENLKQQLEYVKAALQAAEQQYNKTHSKESIDALDQANSKYKELTDTISQNTQKIFENQRAVAELSSSYVKMQYDASISWMNHMVAMGRMTTAQQLAYMNTIDASQLALQDQWKYEEDIYSKRKQAIKDEVDAIKDAYDERTALIEEEIEADEKRIERKEREIELLQEATDLRVKSLQAEIDALEVEAKRDERVESEKEHNDKLLDLQEQRRYHELRVGLEHQQAIADIDKQIAEEEHAWELKKQEWSRDDRKQELEDQIKHIEDQAKEREDALREEIDDIKKSNDKKKNEMQKYYNQIQKLLTDSNLEMLATLSSFDSSWYDRGLEWMRKLAEGIRDGQTELPSGFEDFIGDVKEEHESLPSAGEGEGEESAPTPTKKLKTVITASEYVNKDGTTYMWARTLAEKLGVSAEWKDGMVVLGGKSMFPAWNDNGKAYVNTRTAAALLGYSVTWDDSTKSIKVWDKAHTGAYVQTSGVAELLKGERVLSPQLTVSFDRLATALLKIPSIPDRIGFQDAGFGQRLEQKLDKLISAIRENGGVNVAGNLLNIENAGLEDRENIGVLVRELGQITANRRVIRGRR